MIRKPSNPKRRLCPPSRRLAWELQTLADLIKRTAGPADILSPDRVRRHNAAQARHVKVLELIQMLQIQKTERKRLKQLSGKFADQHKQDLADLNAEIFSLRTQLAL